MQKGQVKFQHDEIIFPFGTESRRAWQETEEEEGLKGKTGILQRR